MSPPIRAIHIKEHKNWNFNISVQDKSRKTELADKPCVFIDAGAHGYTRNFYVLDNLIRGTEILYTRQGSTERALYIMRV